MKRLLNTRTGLHGPWDKSGYGNGLMRHKAKVEEKEEATERSGLAHDLNIYYPIMSYYQLKRLKTVHTS